VEFRSGFHRIPCVLLCKSGLQEKTCRTLGSLHRFPFAFVEGSQLSRAVRSLANSRLLRRLRLGRTRSEEIVEPFSGWAGVRSVGPSTGEYGCEQRGICAASISTPLIGPPRNLGGRWCRGHLGCLGVLVESIVGECGFGGFVGHHVGAADGRETDLSRWQQRGRVELGIRLFSSRFLAYSLMRIGSNISAV